MGLKEWLHDFVKNKLNQNIARSPVFAIRVTQVKIKCSIHGSFKAENLISEKSGENRKGSYKDTETQCGCVGCSLFDG